MPAMVKLMNDEQFSTQYTFMESFFKRKVLEKKSQHHVYIMKEIGNSEFFQLDFGPQHISKKKKKVKC